MSLKPNFDADSVLRVCATPIGEQPEVIWPDFSQVQQGGRNTTSWQDPIVRTRSIREENGIPLYIRRPEMSHVDTHTIYFGDSEAHNVCWDIRKDPHLLAKGDASSGKTMLLRTVVQHCLEHADDWVALVVDADFWGAFPEYEDSSVIPASKPSGSMPMLRTIKKMIEDRQELLSGEGHPHSLRKVMVAINYLEFLVSAEVLANMGDVRDSTVWTSGDSHRQLAAQWAEEAAELIAFILRTGPGVGVHVLATTPSTVNGKAFLLDYQTALTSEILDHFSARFAFDIMDRQERQEFIGGQLPLSAPFHHAGRGTLRVADGVFPLQVYCTGLWLNWQ